MRGGATVKVLCGFQGDNSRDAQRICTSPVRMLLHELEEAHFVADLGPGNPVSVNRATSVALHRGLGKPKPALCHTKSTCTHPSTRSATGRM